MSDGPMRFAADDLPVGVGVQVELELFTADGDSERMSFQIVQDASANFDAGLLSVSTPLARALLGKRAGREIAYTQGDVRKVRILHVAPGTLAAPADAAEKRRAALSQALEEVARTNAEIFAASYTSKWGGYETKDREQGI